MADRSVSFLLECDDEWMITKIFWYQPVYLISPYDKNILNLFRIDDCKRIERNLHEALLAGEKIVYDTDFQILNPKTKVVLSILIVEDKRLIFGQELAVFDENDHASVVRDVTIKFMDAISRTIDRDFAFENERTIRIQFEEIQQLNNNLINLQRELKKSNAKLNLLNQELNNRLVKDELTGLVSRYQYREEVGVEIAKNPERQGIFAFIDIDDFKSVNDHYGHAAGDAFLKEFAKRLMALSYENMICMRIAGDEFGLYLHNYDKVEDADLINLWHRIQEQIIKEPIQINEISLTIMCSVGMSVYGKDTTNVFELIGYADFAMYEAKYAGKNGYRSFDMKRYHKKKVFPTETEAQMSGDEHLVKK